MASINRWIIFPKVNIIIILFNEYCNINTDRILKPIFIQNFRGKFFNRFRYENSKPFQQEFVAVRFSSLFGDIK
jgi:hypothetical protein